jgi:ketosteroid isomerase-like protein
MNRTRIFALLSVFAVSAMALGKEINNKNRGAAEELRKLDNIVLNAEKGRDVRLLEDFFAPSYLLILPSGEVYTKEKWLGLLKSPDHPVIEAINVANIQVHVFGDVAVVTDTTTVRSHDSKGQVSGGTFSVLRVMLKRRGKWQVAGVELSALESK